MRSRSSSSSRRSSMRPCARSRRSASAAQATTARMPDGARDERDELAALEVADPLQRARAGVVEARHQDEQGHGRQGAVARERAAPRRRGVELAEAMAVGRASAREAHADRRAEQEQQHERPQRTPPGGRLGQEQHGHGQLRQRQRDADDAGQPGRDAECGDCAAATREVCELGRAGDGEHRRQHEPRYQQCGAHGRSPCAASLTLRTVARRRPVVACRAQPGASLML